MLISEEIKSLALNTKILKFHNYMMEGFRINLKTFLGLAMPNQSVRK